MSIPSDLLNQILELGPEARKELIRHLIISLEPVDESLTPQEWEAAWAVELEERMRRYESGETRSISAAEFFERLRGAVRQGSPS